MTDYKLTLDTEKARILFSSLLNTQVECRRIEEDKDATAKYPTLVGMASLTQGVIDDVLDTMFAQEEGENETI
jgi:hypothetical protein